jgi:hypothetical protein
MLLGKDLFALLVEPNLVYKKNTNDAVLCEEKYNTHEHEQIL